MNGHMLGLALSAVGLVIAIVTLVFQVLAYRKEK